MEKDRRWGPVWQWGLSLTLAMPCLAQSPVLSLETAIRLALERNRAIQRAALQAEGMNDAIRAARTQRLPSFKTSATSGMLLFRPTITFARGVFGDYPGLGPIPGSDTSVSPGRKPTALVSSEASLPLTSQRRIRFGIRMLEIGKKIADQQVRLTRHEIVSQVRQTYYSIAQAQSSLEAVEQSLALLNEITTQTAQHVKTGTALEADLLKVRARLAQAEYEKVTVQSPLASLKEQMNVLTGRPLEEEFRVEPVPEGDPVPDLSAARANAAASRPEIEQARLKVQQAEADKLKKKAEFIPDVALSVTYYSAFNSSNILPRNVAIAGFQASWEMFDWGRKRHEIAQKQKGVEEASLAVKDLEDKVKLETGRAHRKMEEARWMLRASRAGQQSAAEAARLASVRYRVEAVLLNSVLEAQAELAAANDKIQKALVAYWSARAEFEKAMGVEP